MSTLQRWPSIRFGPRRLGHVNLFVSDLDTSLEFYRRVCGLELVYDEKDLFARFLSNGNSHHDVALMEASAKELVGRDGEVQKSSVRGTVAGLNHLAFEMETEASLVEGIRRARSLGSPPDSLYDHQISRSAYLAGPDCVEIEVYADSTTEWREVYRRLGTGLMSARWDPEHSLPSPVPRYTAVPDHRPAANGLARPLRTARAALVTADLEATMDYYERVVGLTVAERDEGPGRWAILCGTLGAPDLLLLEQQRSEPIGLHHFGLQLPDEQELERSHKLLAKAGIPIEREVLHDRKHGIVIQDPDGIAVELFALPKTDSAIRYKDLVTPATREFLL